MPLIFKKVTEYDWDVTVQTPHKGKFKKETFTAKFKNVSRKDFDKMIDGGDDNFVKTVLVGWSGIKDEGGNDGPFDDDNLEAVMENHYIGQAIIVAYGESMKRASEKTKRGWRSIGYKAML
jgi:hypothetical protein